MSTSRRPLTPGEDLRAEGPPVVGIGASAGGIEALKAFFAGMPWDSGMAFVVVQHLEPSRESRMAEILAKTTGMDVAQAEDGIVVKSNHVYTNDPGRYLAISGGRLVLSGLPEGHAARLPIDYFFESLAADQGSRAISIILSGSSAADGPRGVRAVRSGGGICMAQDPKTAQFAAMPQGAIDTGLVDYILPVEQMPAALQAYRRYKSEGASRLEGASIVGASGILESILELLWRSTNNDYRSYQRATLTRRIQRRMAIRQVDSPSGYLELLQRDEREQQLLCRDMLIGVSSFFRDPEVFEELRQRVIVPMIEGKSPGSPVRAWVPGCATGEEAYSLAMLMMEALAAANKSCPVQVFASDVNADAVETGRAGSYPENIAVSVSAERLESFFTRRGNLFEVDKRLREAVIFSHQNLISDPPFSKLDLVSCRNVLIYLEPSAQKQVLSLFAFALNPGGCLLLGKSEGTAGMEEAFEPVSKPNRIYRLSKSSRRTQHLLAPYPVGKRPAETPERDHPDPKAAALWQASQQALLRHFDAALLLVDPAGRILHFFGETERYMGHPKGLAGLNVLDMSTAGLSLKLRRAIEQALHQEAPVAIPQVAALSAGLPPSKVTVERVRSTRGAQTILAIIFEDAREAPPPAIRNAAAIGDEPLVAQLEGEVKALRDELRENAGEHDLATEQLKAANEEVMSMNEELQSANEELEASKEEMQSVNEELSTVNGQLSEKLNELTAANNDLANLMGATEIATVFLDSQLRIKRYTRKATELLNLIPSDTGRPVGHVAQNFTDRQIADDAEATLHSLQTLETEVRTRDGRWYTMRVMPYRTLDDRIDGVVVTFSDVSRLKETQDKLEYSTTYAQTIVETTRYPMVVLNDRQRVLSGNAAFYRTFRLTEQETVGQPLFGLASGSWDIPRLRELLEAVSREHATLRDLEVEQSFPEIGRRTLVLDARWIEAVGEVPARILLAIEDITERATARKELLDFSEQLEQRVTERTALAEQRAEQLRRLASELTQTEQRERERLARVLHDDLQQLLVGAKLQLSAVSSIIHDERPQKAIAGVKDILARSLEISRTLTAELSPTILSQVGLEAALGWLAGKMETSHGLVVHTEMEAHVEKDGDGVAVLLYQAVRELLLNTVKHAGVKSARVRLRRIEGDKVEVTVSDEGKGMDQAAVSSAGTPRSGLGLFGIRERLEHLGGQLLIESAPGHGTRVRMVAAVRPSPKRSATAPAAAALPAPAMTLLATRSADGRRRVLVMDDSAIVREGLRGLLSAEPDLEVVAEAGSGLEGIELARVHRPDVVLVDVRMAEMSGVDAARAIHSEQPGVRIIALTMYAEDDQIGAMREAGAITYVSKAGPFEDLLAAVRGGT